MGANYTWAPEYRILYMQNLHTHTDIDETKLKEKCRKI